MLLIRMALLDRTVAIEDLLKGLGVVTPGAATIQPASGSVRAQVSQASGARTAQRRTTRARLPAPD